MFTSLLWPVLRWAIPNPDLGMSMLSCLQKRVYLRQLQTFKTDFIHEKGWPSVDMTSLAVHMILDPLTNGWMRPPATNKRRLTTVFVGLTLEGTSVLSCMQEWKPLEGPEIKTLGANLNKNYHLLPQNEHGQVILQAASFVDLISRSQCVTMGV